jgi:hypothetical protein
MPRGDSRRIRITATWPEDVPEYGAVEGDPYPLSGKLCAFTGKTKLNLSDADAVFKKTSDPGDGITVRPDPDDNVADVEIAPEDTEALTKESEVFLDFQVTDEPGGTVWTVWEGMMVVYPTATQESGLDA